MLDDVQVRGEFGTSWRSLLRASALLRQADVLLRSKTVSAERNNWVTVTMGAGTRPRPLIPYRPWSAYPVSPAETDWTDAGRYLDELARVLQTIRPSRRSDRVRARAMESQGRFWLRVGRWREAEKHFRDALVLFQKMEQNVEASRCNGHLADLFSQTGRWAEAERSLRAWLPVPLTAGDEASVLALINLGDLFASTGRNAAAEQHYRRALELCPKKKLMVRRSSALSGLGDVLAEMKRFPEALEALDIALKIEMGEGGTHILAALTHQRISSLYRSQGDVNLARYHLLQSNLMFQQAGVPEYVAMSNYELSTFHLSQREGASALQLYNGAFSLYARLGKYQSAARIALSRAGQLVRASDPEQDNQINESMHLALPAFLHLDRVRFQFDTSSERQKWAGFVEWAASLTFHIAIKANDARIIADLIETCINSAAHTATAASSSELSATPRLWNSSAVDSLLPGTESISALTAAGSSRLLAGSTLPAGPGPLLLIPTGTTGLSYRVALREVYENSSYPQQDRTQRAIRIC